MGLSPELFKRLSQLNRKLLRERLVAGDRVEAPGAAEPPPGETGPDLALETVLPGAEGRSRRGRFYRVVRPADEIFVVRTPAARAPGAVEESAGEWLDGPRLLAEYRRTFFGAGCAVTPDVLHEEVRALLTADPGRITYLDIESCGLAGEPLFLVGLLRCRDRRLVIDQFLARDYSEEGAILEAVREELAPTECLVTFNGKTFDLPTIQARSLACGVFDVWVAPAHVDLLHEARRRWRSEVPNCRLQTLEQCICNRRRAGDIPGPDIPAAYHEFVRAHQGGDPRRRTASLRRLQTIVHHNALDLLTMAELALRILTEGRAPGKPGG